MQVKPKVIFIISAGHSGSTLLDLLIGTLSDVVSTGELIWLPWQVWRDGKQCTATPKQDICTCLKTFRECSVWSSVLRNISRQSGLDIFNNPLIYNISFLRHKKYTSGMSYKYRILRKLMKTAIIYNKVWMTDMVLNTQRESIFNTLILYDSIAETLKTPFIVDSSKDILRTYAIWKQRPEDISVVLLYKDAKSYAASGKHWNSEAPIEKRLKEWLHIYQNSYVSILHKMVGCNILCVKYDDLAREPEMVRNTLANFIGTDCADSNFKINTKDMHIVAGNPMRFKGIIDIKYDDRWRLELNSEEIKLAEQYEQQMQNLISTLPAQWSSSTQSSLS